MTSATTEIDWERRARAAERTVEVLKSKVLEMYGDGDYSPLHRALELAKQRDERNKQRRELMEVRAEELAKHNGELEIKVAERAHAIKVILDNVTCGFLRIDADAVIRPGYSRSCAALFGAEDALDGRRLTTFLGIEGRPEGDEFHLAIEQVFDDLLPPEVSLAQMPTRFESSATVLDVQGRLIRDDDGEPESVLFTITDISELEQAQRENLEREVVIDILRQRVAFEHFLADVRAILASARLHLDDQAYVRRAVHTIKGNAASWRIDTLASRAHLVEGSDTVDGDDIESLERSLCEFLSSRVELSWAVYDDSGPTFDVPAEELHALRAMAEDPDRLADIRTWAAGVLERPVSEFLGPIDTFADRLGDRLGKTIEFSLDGAEVGVDAEIVGPVLREANHLVRNAIDHGIEVPEERIGKPAEGAVEMTVRPTDTGWCIEVADDGRGVQADALVDRALASTMITADEAASLDDDGRLALMFLDGLSTAKAATEVSGRGVGMSAVLAAVRHAGGTITTETGAWGTRFRIDLPRRPEQPVGAATGESILTG
ncbi:MAG: ATP-binding protein [Actinomycetota bacterium]